MQSHFELGGGRAHAVGATQQRFQVFQNLLGKYVAQGGADGHVRVCRFAPGSVEHTKQGVVYVGNSPARVQREHARGNAFQNGFNVPASLFQRDVGGAQVVAGGVNLAAAGFQFFRHAVERAYQIADFIRGTHLHPVVQASARNFLRRLGQRHYRAGHKLRQIESQPGGRKQH